jgi:transcription initiation factor TFIIB
MYYSLSCVMCNLGETKMVTDLESGEIICSNCGTIVADCTEDPRKGFNSLTDGKDTISNGPPISLALHDMGLATQMGKVNRDSSGQLLDLEMRSQMNRLRTWDARIQTRDASLRSFRTAFTLLNKLKDKLGLTYAVIEKTAYIYRKAQQDGLVRGKMISSNLAASLYIACRELGISRTVDEIALAANIRKNTLTRNYRSIVLRLDLRVPQINHYQCIEKIASRVGLSEKIKRQAAQLMGEIIKNEMAAGKDPMGIAGAAIYLCMQLEGVEIKQSELAVASAVTEVTLRNRTKELKNKLRIG